MMNKGTPEISVIMGSQSDWSVMIEASSLFEELGIPHETKIISAHRTPDRMADFAKTASSNGIKVIIAGAGGAAHLPGMVAAYTHIPVLGVPVETKALKGMDSLLSIVQMPAGIPVATVAINGAKNAGLLAIQILSLVDKALRVKIKKFRENLHAQVRTKNSKLSAMGADNYLKTD